MVDVVKRSAWVEGSPVRYEIGMICENSLGMRWLVGEVNVNGGECDCCGVPLERADVVRWCLLSDFLGDEQ